MREAKGHQERKLSPSSLSGMAGLPKGRLPSRPDGVWDPISASDLIIISLTLHFSNQVCLLSFQVIFLQLNHPMIWIVTSLHYFIIKFLNLLFIYCSSQVSLSLTDFSWRKQLQMNSWTSGKIVGFLNWASRSDWTAGQPWGRLASRPTLVVGPGLLLSAL